MDSQISNVNLIRRLPRKQKNLIRRLLSEYLSAASEIKSLSNLCTQLLPRDIAASSQCHYFV